jgi:HEAT repeat protein
MISSTQSQLDTLLNHAAPASQRAHAASGLGDMDAPDVVEALLDVAQNPTEDDTVSRAAGDSLARILIRHGSIADAPLHSFSGPAYLAFDETVAAHQRGMDTTLDESSTGTISP